MATEDTTKEVSASSKEEAANILANQYFNNASAAEALALVPFNTLIQLVKNQVVAQSQSEVETMTDEQVETLLKAAESAASEGVAPPEGE
jgi:hypothetical protein